MASGSFPYPARHSVPAAMQEAAGDSEIMSNAYPLLATMRRRQVQAQEMAIPKAPGEKAHNPGPGRPPKGPISGGLRGTPGLRTKAGMK